VTSSARRFASDGYLHLERFVDPGELPDLRAEVERVLAAPPAPGCERPHNVLAPLGWEHPIVAAVLGDADRMERLRRALDARDLRWISAYVSAKPPCSAALAWHQDWWCWDQPVSYRRAAPQVAVLCYLGDTTRATGALRVLPGTHHRSVDLHRALPEAHSVDGAVLDDRHPAMADHPRQLTLEAGAGDAVVADYRVLHGTHANPGSARRDCLVLTFAPDWAGLPDAVRAHLIRHPAQPSETAPRTGAAGALLPDYVGVRRDLPLNRVAPVPFAARA
jgi:ectoine hydroxylase-related dioxygenase (phytanoyl-CoA dioxygenase family)